MFILLTHGIGIIAMDGMIPGMTHGTDGMPPITVTASIAGMTGDCIIVLHGILAGVVTYIILHITIMEV